MKKIIALSLICVLTLVLLTACTKTEDAQPKTEEVLGTVTAIDGEQVTISVMSGQPNGQGGTPPGGQPNGQGGTPPDGQPSGQPDGQGGTPPDGQPSGQPDGQGGTPPDGQPSGQPDGQGGTPPDGQPSGQPDGQGGNPMQGESKTLTVDTAILYKLADNTETSALLSDITVGAMLKITYCNDVITKIVIGTAQQPNP